MISFDRFDINGESHLCVILYDDERLIVVVTRDTREYFKRYQNEDEWSRIEQWNLPWP